MKKLLFLLPLWYLPQLLYAQVCANPQSQIDILGNNLKARILNGGDLFTDFNSGQFIPNPVPGSSNPSTIYAAGLWLGGIDPAGNLQLATTSYRSNSRYDFAAGPLSPAGITNANTCSNWDRHFKVTDDRIAAFLAALPMSAAELIDQFPDIAGWPGNNNPHFETVNGFSLPAPQPLAPFYDADNNGAYNPLSGDYPAVIIRETPPFVPAEIIWCVFNDHKGGGMHSNSGGKAFQMEVQLTAWTFDCPDEPVLNRTLFTAHKLIHRGLEACDSTFIGIWADVDLGCSDDDYVGCYPDLNTIFAYNTDPVDGLPGNTCQGTPTFAGVPPVQTITYLNRPLDKFIVPNSNGGGTPPPATLDPQTPLEIFNYLSGSWRDGSPITQGGIGYGGSMPTNHMFPSLPSDLNGWSMCTESLSFSDRRVLGSAKVGRMLPGQVEELVLAWAFHPEPNLPCGLGNALAEVTALKIFYDNGLEKICSALSTSLLPEHAVSLAPNPANATVWVQHKEIAPQSIRLFDAQGRLAREISSGFGATDTMLDLAGLPAGLYTLQLGARDGIASRKLIIAR
ncbi:MAG: T9SS type A sorting domain-containing protein [Saprospiraceae bacterium]|nr:T9SS type A sorting domain-containing protein [Saprospiraceae bacterium]